MATEFATRREGRRANTWLVTGGIACVLALAATLLVVLRGAAEGGPFARLRPLDPRVEVRAAGEGDYALGEMDQQLQVGDTVRTDPQGRGEIAYHEGSLTRLGPDATFELAELTDAPALHLRLEVGQLWQRVARLTGTEGSFRLHTPAATATVAGTVFAADCIPDGACTFTVIEGRLHLTTTTGEELTLEAGEQVTITPGGAPGKTQQLTEDDLWTDDWIAYNLEQDGQTRPATPAPTPEPTPEPDIVEARRLPLGGEGLGPMDQGESCPPPPESYLVPPEARCLVVIEADLDGDGQVDRLLFYFLPSSGGSSGTRIARAVLADGPTVDLTVARRVSLGWGDVWSPSGAGDMTGDGSDEVLTLTSVSGGTGGSGYYIVQFRSGELFLTQDEGTGEPFVAEARQGGGDVGRFGAGLDCRDVTGDGRLEFIEREAEIRADSTTHTLIERIYRWVDPRTLSLFREDIETFERVQDDTQPGPEIPEEYRGDRCTGSF